jgi:exonuclease III
MFLKKLQLLLHDIAKITVRHRILFKRQNVPSKKEEYVLQVDANKKKLLLLGTTNAIELSCDFDSKEVKKDREREKSSFRDDQRSVIVRNLKK